MRYILVDHARSHAAKNRGRGQRGVPIDEALVFTPEKSFDLLRLDESLQRLAILDARQAKVVELRFFRGSDWRSTR